MNIGDFYSKNTFKIKSSKAVDTIIHLMEESMFVEIKKALEEKAGDQSLAFLFTLNGRNFSFITPIAIFFKNRHLT